MSDWQIEQHALQTVWYFIYRFLSNHLDVHSSISLSSSEEYLDSKHDLQLFWRCTDIPLETICSYIELADFCEALEYCYFPDEPVDHADDVYDSNGNNGDIKILMESSGDLSKMAISGDERGTPGVHNPPSKDHRNHDIVFGKIISSVRQENFNRHPIPDNDFVYGKMVFHAKE
ncbi:uncharacterized protein [Fopius arisanus]|uniref:Uncharacterized protein n=1 Tax=Fopius arisanus TaxID=64838 RepID=A0A9R1TAT0_9HYME|nr:PREDICTED: uncharacterized protein LOC105268141 [Fopius arisanus]